MPSDIQTQIASMPKAELHMHLEGSIEPDLMFHLAARNGMTLPYASEEALSAAYDFADLKAFLDVYYAGLNVLRTSEDFYDMTLAYLARSHRDKVVHAEMFISPQAHTRRGIALAAMFEGIIAAMDKAQSEFGMSTQLIAGLQRQWPEDEAFAMIDAVVASKARVSGLGLGGPEMPHPPRKFERAFAYARSLGWRTVAHAGEEGPASYVADAVDFLKVDRVDHGVRCDEDPALVARLAHLQVPLTVCPISNVKLKVFPDLASHNLKRLLDAGVCVTVNSDDPSYFGGYMNANYAGCADALGLSRADIRQLARNGFSASFLDDADKSRHLAALDVHFDG